MGRPAATVLPISQPHNHSNGSIRTLGTASIRKPERSISSSHHYAQNSTSTHQFPIPNRHSSTQKPSQEPSRSQSTSKTQHTPYPHPSQAPSQRPTGLTRQNSVQTRYMTMLLSLDTIPRLHNILASFFTWILLAGFIIFPGTFTNLQTLEDNPTISSSEAATAILHSVKHVSLLVIGAICCGMGAIGMVWLWYKHYNNYVWLLNRIFLPGCLNSLAGLISTLINVYSQQDGDWSVTAKVTAIVTGCAMCVCGGLFGVYDFWILKRVKRKHGREMQVEEEGREDEGFVEKMGRKVNKPALEPGSVV